MKLNNLQRSRLKITIIGGVVLLVVLMFPMYIIYEASGIGLYDVSAPWVAFGTTITTIGAILGYYLNRETVRPSFMTINTNPVKRILEGEDESDPNEIPL